MFKLIIIRTNGEVETTALDDVPTVFAALGMARESEDVLSCMVLRDDGRTGWTVARFHLVG